MPILRPLWLFLHHIREGRSAFALVTPAAKFVLAEPPDPKWNLNTWGDVFALEPMITDRVKTTLRKMSDEAVNAIKEKLGFPNWYSCDLNLADSHNDCSPVKLRLTLGWRIYEGDVTASLLNGTYCLTEDRFVGSQTTPWIDTKGPHPGPAWRLLESHPLFPKSGTVAILYGGIRDAELQVLATKPVSILPKQIATADSIGADQIRAKTSA